MKSILPWKKNELSTDQNFARSLLPKRLRDPFSNLFSSEYELSNTPSIDIKENKNEIVVRAELPGMSMTDVTVNYENGILTIRGEKKEEMENDREGTYYCECRYGSFSRNIEVGTAIQWEKAQAKYKNGILTIVMPKSQVESKAIQVKIQ